MLVFQVCLIIIQFECAMSSATFKEGSYINIEQISLYLRSTIIKLSLIAALSCSAASATCSFILSFGE